jgi:protein-L-isoaspartate O-methyltransferase
VRGWHSTGRPGSPEGLVRALRAEGIGDRRLIAAFRAVPRARFVPPAATHQAYVDEPIRIPHGQVTTQPSLIARMVAALNGSLLKRARLWVAMGEEQRRC